MCVSRNNRKKQDVGPKRGTNALSKSYREKYKTQKEIHETAVKMYKTAVETQKFKQETENMSYKAGVSKHTKQENTYK